MKTLNLLLNELGFMVVHVQTENLIQVIENNLIACYDM